MRPARPVPLLLVLAAVVLVALATDALAADNHTPTTAAPLDQYNHVTEEVNGSDDQAEYWYWLDIARGDELFVYFYGTGERYHRCRMLYYVHGPDSYGSGDVVHAEYWYRQRPDRNDHSDVWSWICPEGGRYYFHFYAVGEAVGPFHANISLDHPQTIYRFGTDTGTLWWGGVANQNRNDVWRIWLAASASQVEGVQVTVTWTSERRVVHLYAYDLVDRYEQNMLNLSYGFPDDEEREVIRFTASYTGWYYVRVEYGNWSGTEQYTLSTREYSAPNDGDNDVANATHLLKTSTITGRMEASRDMHDWYTVDLFEGDLLGISMQIMDPHNPAYNPGAANFFNFFEIQVYDPHMRRVGHGYDRNQGWPVPDTYINNLPIQPADVTVNGTYHIRASFSYSYGYFHDADNTSGHVIAFCDYVLQLTIPNRAPRVNGTALEDVYLLEDTTWWENLAGENVSSLDLDTVFIDPELGVMTFSVRGDDNVTARLVDEHLLTLRPRRDWNGEARVTLVAEDDGGNDASAHLRVLVVPVNDPPRIHPPSAITFLEDDPSVENRTINMYDCFYDVDLEHARNLTFSGDGSPPDIWVTFDQGTGNATFGTAEDVNGDFHVVLLATDPGDLSERLELKVSVVPVNDAPRPADDPPTYEFDEGFGLETFDAADHLEDPDGDTELIWIVEYADPSDEVNLSVTNEGKSIWNSEIVLTPATNRHDWHGQLVVRITCTDQGGLSGQQEFTIVVRNTPDPPEIAAWTPRTDAEFAEGGTMNFSVDDVRDPDGEDAVLHFSFWLLGPGDLTAHQVQNGTGHSWEMAADYESEGAYKVTVIVYDEDLMSTASPLEWLVTVTKTNRAPTVNITSPGEGETFVEGSWVEFEAEAHDPDVEDRSGLLVEWYEGDTWLGKGGTFSLRNLRPGTHEITAVVTDGGELSSEATVSIGVREKGEEPGFSAAVAALSVLAASWALATVDRRGRR